MGEHLDTELSYHRLLSTTIDLGVLLLVNGAEIYRVEESMQRILKAYGIESTDVFAIPNLIILSMETADKETVTKTRRVYARGTNYRIVCEVNDYVRYI
ncbi:MAG: threonine/serine exporter family protein, partial [Clostridiales bacterium]|nr:threonine/serine exporter family protein [Clostridiales bacterium]